VSACGASAPQAEAPSEGSTAASSGTAEATTGADPGRVRPLPAGEFDYQLGGAYDPARKVDVVVRDRGERPLSRGYSICYINAFQTQPDERDRWDDELLLTVKGKPVTDPDWPDENLLDTSSAETRAGIVKTLTPWIRGCARDGFDAVEFDNLDSYTRSKNALTMRDNAALAEELVKISHESGLAAAQKNLAEHAAALKDSAGFDLAVAEECAAYEECADYTDAYGDAVVDIEYADDLPEPFTELCKQAGTPEAMILRDRDLLTPGDAGYVYRRCP
jgi:hypothetical protein